MFYECSYLIDATLRHAIGIQQGDMATPNLHEHNHYDER